MMKLSRSVKAAPMRRLAKRAAAKAFSGEVGPEMQEAIGEDAAREDFHHPVAEGYAYSAALCLATQEKPGEDGQVEGPGDGFAAGNAAGTGLDHGLLAGDAMGAHVEKAPDDGAEDEGDASRKEGILEDELGDHAGIIKEEPSGRP